MVDILVYPAGSSEAIRSAAFHLQKRGVPLVDHPTPEATHLLLDVPARTVPVSLLEQLPERITVVGGNLIHPELAESLKMDLLRNEAYLAANAAITADCAIRVAAEHMKTTFPDSPALVIGWGRIGKCLVRLLKDIGCPVTVAARKDADRAMLKALGYEAYEPGALPELGRFDLIFNTAPAPMLGKSQLSRCPAAVKIDLASLPGLEGEDVIWARGLPGRYAPESSGKLIAETFLKLCREGTS